MDNIKKRESAQAMIVVFVYISVVSLIGIYLMLMAGNLHSLVAREIRLTQAFYAAQAALVRSIEAGAARNFEFGPMTATTTVQADPNGTGLTNLYTAEVSGWLYDR